VVHKDLRDSKVRKVLTAYKVARVHRDSAVRMAYKDLRDHKGSKVSRALKVRKAHAVLEHKGHLVSRAHKDPKALRVCVVLRDLKGSRVAKVLRDLAVLKVPREFKVFRAILLPLFAIQVLKVKFLAAQLSSVKVTLAVISSNPR
jgi:hypothetical protein